MSAEDFANISPGELRNKITGFHRAKKAQLQESIDNALYVARWQTMFLLNTETKKKWIFNSVVKESDLHVFSWEEQEVTTAIPSAERRAEIKAITDKWANPDNKRKVFNTPEELNAYLADLNK